MPALGPEQSQAVGREHVSAPAECASGLGSCWGSRQL